MAPFYEAAWVSRWALLRKEAGHVLDRLPARDAAGEEIAADEADLDEFASRAGPPAKPSW